MFKGWNLLSGCEFSLLTGFLYDIIVNGVKRFYTNDLEKLMFVCK